MNNPEEGGPKRPLLDELEEGRTYPTKPHALKPGQEVQPKDVVEEGRGDMFKKLTE